MSESYQFKMGEPPNEWGMSFATARQVGAVGAFNGLDTGWGTFSAYGGPFSWVLEFTSGDSYGQRYFEENKDRLLKVLREAGALRTSFQNSPTVPVQMSELALLEGAL